MDITREQAEEVSEAMIRRPEIRWNKEVSGRRTFYKAQRGDVWVVTYHEPLQGTTIVELGMDEKVTVPSYVDLVGISLVDKGGLNLGSHEERGEFGFERDGRIIVYSVKPTLGPAGRLYEHVSALEKSRAETEKREGDKKRLEDAVSSVRL